MRADKETTDRIKHLLAEEPEVRGAFDLILHNYGPNKDLASVHLELPDTMTVREVDRLTRRVESKIYSRAWSPPGRRAAPLSTGWAIP